MQGDLAISLAEFGIGFGLSLVVGVLLGVAMGMSRWVEYATDPFIWFLYASPLIAVYPLLIVWLGIDEAPKLTLIAVSTALPVYMNTHGAIRGVDRHLVDTARTLGFACGPQGAWFDELTDRDREADLQAAADDAAARLEIEMSLTGKVP